MASCYLCDAPIPKGQSLRKRVYTGLSIGGFNFSSNLVLNWILNSIFNRSRASVRSYYSIRTICPNCAVRIDIANKRKVLTILILGLVAALVLALIVATSR